MLLAKNKFVVLLCLMHLLYLNLFHCILQDLSSKLVHTNMHMGKKSRAWNSALVISAELWGASSAAERG